MTPTAKKHVQLKRVSEELARRRQARAGYSPQEPHAKQSAFVGLTCPEALYGGAAGGGKSSALLMCALKYTSVRNFSALILRRTYQELVMHGALMDRAHEWLSGTKAKWEASSRRWSFPSGASVEFGYFDNWNDRMRYQSSQFNLVCFDELTHFPEEWYAFMFTRTRRDTGSSVPSMVRSATNPGGIGHEWVKRRFLVEKHTDRTFVPATFRDNPFVDHSDYERQLALAMPIIRRQMLGEWVNDGIGLVYGQYSPDRDNVQEVPKLDYYLCGLDFGIVDENAVTVLGWRNHDSTVYIVESYRKKALVHEMSDEVKELDRAYNFVQIVGDTGGMGKAFSEDMRQRHHVPLEAAEKHNKTGNISLLNDDFSRGRIKVRSSACADLIEEYKSLYWDETGKKEQATCPNHASDSMLYAWRACCAFVETPAEKTRPGTLEDAERAHAEALLSLPEEDRIIWERQDERLNEEKQPWWAQ